MYIQNMKKYVKELELYLFISIYLLYFIIIDIHNNRYYINIFFIKFIEF